MDLRDEENSKICHIKKCHISNDFNKSYPPQKKYFLCNQIKKEFWISSFKFYNKISVIAFDLVNLIIQIESKIQDP